MKTLPTAPPSPRADAGPDGSECLVMLYGRSIGRKFDLVDDEVVIGRDSECAIVLEANHVSRQHAMIRRDGRGRRIIEDLASTNGTYINDRSVRTRGLQSGDLIQVGEVILKYLRGGDLESAYYEEIYRMAITDGLTGVANKRHLDQYLEREFARSRRHGRDLALLFLDLDHFKEINDGLGHVAGDLVLRDFAQLVKQRIRADEIFARFGGEEFVVVLPEATTEAAAEFGEIIRAMVEAHPFVFDGEPVPVTVSVGVACYNAEMSTPLDLIRAADSKVYEAKAAGRNRVVS